MVSLDYSLIPAILIFLTVVIALNYLLFKPLMRVQAEREERTTGVIELARKKLSHHLDLFDRYQAAIKAGRLEGYRLQEQARAEAEKKRAEVLGLARQRAETLLQESRTSIQAQMQAAKQQLSRDVHEMARGIATAILQRSA